MARPLRIEYEDALYHVTARGNERKDIFSDDVDREKFLELLERYVERHGTVIFCYVLMDNHYHIFIRTPAANLASFMHGLQSHYTGWYNYRHGRAGHLFQGRYKAVVVDRDEYLVELSRYIHLNPIRAGIGEKPEDWQWSSYQYYIRSRPEAKWIDRNEVLGYFGKNITRASRAYREFVEAGIQTPPDNPMGKLASQMILGSEDFIEEMKHRLKARHILSEDISEGKDILKWTGKEAQEALEKIAAFYKVSPETLKEKKRRCNWPRDVAIWVFHKLSRWTSKEIGKEFSIGYSAAGKAARRVEQAESKNKKLSKEIKALYSHFPA